MRWRSKLIDWLRCGHPVGKDFVLLASDQSAGRSIIKMKSDENKIRQLSPSLCMAYGGEPGERILGLSRLLSVH
jgi:20S proteasome alpha/beta subunit